MHKKVKILILTYIPSPYQVEFFNAISESDDIVLTVAYIYAKSNTPTARFWTPTELRHNYIILNDDLENYEAVKTLMDTTDLVVFSYYQHPMVMQLIKHRINHQQAWCYWGERPGYKQLGWLGIFYRRWKFSALHQSKVSIWGIGQWAVEQYQREFETDRKYFNVPYFSNLERFNHVKNVTSSPGRHFLYSGSLIHRKGVDLLASAFCELAKEFPSIKLSIVGEGKLRSYLENQLAQYGDRVTFFGFQPWEALPSFYQAADILCVPSRYDGWALVVPEGLAAGLPVISTNYTGAALELIRDGENGWLIPANSQAYLYKGMRKAVLLSETELSHLSLSARSTISQHSLKHGVNHFYNTVNATLSLYENSSY
jgi:glycosyltransferase involved in cell wall biosynthesis